MRCRCVGPSSGEWLKAFESKDFLPNLQNLGVVLDVYYQPSESDWIENEETRAPEEALYEAAWRRVITIYPVHDE